SPRAICRSKSSTAINLTSCSKISRKPKKCWPLCCPMFLSTDDNPNCGLMEPRVFQERTDPQSVSHVLRRRGEKDVWCAIVAMENEGQPGPALARKVDDSGEGTCYLVYG